MGGGVQVCEVALKAKKRRERRHGGFWLWRQSV